MSTEEGLRHGPFPGRSVYGGGRATTTMTETASTAFGLLALGAATVVSVLVANLEPQPEYPDLMTDLLRVLGIVIAGSGAVVGVAFLAGPTVG